MSCDGCGPVDFTFPMLADVYYPIVEQSSYGAVKKNWVLDKTIACSFTAAGTGFKEEVVVNIDLSQSSLLVGRVKSDIRVSSRDDGNAITNVIVTNIRNKNGNPTYVETSGVRKNKSTIFEIATQQPFSGPFGDIEYYKVILRRSENQAEDI
jgi:hypothetical protein